MTLTAKLQHTGPTRVYPQAKGPLVVHVVRQFYPNRGGLEDVVMNLCRGLIARGYRVRVVTLDRLYLKPETKLPAFEVHEGIEIVRVPWSGSTRYPLAPSVFRHVRDADLIHVHAIDFFFDALSLGWMLHRRPMVATTHGGFFHTTKFALIKKIWFQTLTRMSALGYAHIIGCSRSDTALFAKIAPGRTVTVENGADTAKFADCASQTATRRIVTIGRFSVNKRIDRLLDAMRVLAGEHPDWHLDVIGVPGDITEEALGVFIGERGLEGRVSVHCNLDNPGIARLIGGASILASASEYEGFGLVAIEGMSAGLVPVLHANEAYRLLAERHDCVTITDFSDPNKAAKALADAFDAVESGGALLRKTLMAQAQIYSWNGVTDQYCGIYDHVIPDETVGLSLVPSEGPIH